MHTARFLSDVGLICTNAQRIRPDLLSDVGLRKHCCEHPDFYRDCVRAHNPTFYRRQKSDPIYHRGYCAVIKADMVPLLDHGPVMFYLTGFGAHDMIFIADK